MDSTEIANFQAQVKAAQAAILHFENLPKDEATAFSGGSELAKHDAENVLAQPIPKQRICAGLQLISNDLDKITDKILDKITDNIIEQLLPLVAAGTLLISPNPIVYGWIGILVFRATVAGLCAEFQQESKDHQK
jgi:hypothetical protein